MTRASISPRSIGRASLIPAALAVLLFLVFELRSLSHPPMHFEKHLSSRHGDVVATEAQLIREHVVAEDTRPRTEDPISPESEAAPVRAPNLEVRIEKANGDGIHDVALEVHAAHGRSFESLVDLSTSDRAAFLKWWLADLIERMRISIRDDSKALLDDAAAHAKDRSVDASWFQSWFESVFEGGRRTSVLHEFAISDPAVAMAQTDATGVARFSLEPGDYVVKVTSRHRVRFEGANASNGTSDPFTMADDTGILRLRGSSGVAAIHGRLLLAHALAHPVRIDLLRIEEAPAKDVRWSIEPEAMMESGDGSFSFEGVRAGRYRIFAIAEHGARSFVAYEARCDLLESEVRDLGDVPRREGGSVAARVVVQHEGIEVDPLAAFLSPPSRKALEPPRMGLQINGPVTAGPGVFNFVLHVPLGVPFTIDGVPTLDATIGLLPDLSESGEWTPHAGLRVRWPKPVRIEPHDLEIVVSLVDVLTTTLTIRGDCLKAPQSVRVMVCAGDTAAVSRFQGTVDATSPLVRELSLPKGHHHFVAIADEPEDAAGEALYAEGTVDVATRDTSLELSLATGATLDVTAFDVHGEPFARPIGLLPEAWGDSAMYSVFQGRPDAAGRLLLTGLPPNTRLVDPDRRFEPILTGPAGTTTKVEIHRKPYVKK